MDIDALLDIWSEGQLMAFSGLDGQTSFAEGLVARTGLNSSGACLEIKLPAPFKIEIPRIEKSVSTGDFFVLETARGKATGVFADAFNMLIEGPCSCGPAPEGMEIAKRDGKLLVATKGKLRKELLDAPISSMIAERRKWLESIEIPEGLPLPRAKTLAKAFSQAKTQVYAPEGRIKCRWTTPDRWPHGKMWLWDSAFHAIGLRHVDPQLAREAIEALFRAQGANGFIPHMASPYDASEITQPPVLAFAAWLVNEKRPEKEWLAKIYPKLKAYLEWDLANRDRDGAGLLEWFIEGNPFCRSGESGADNSSRFDSAANLDAADFNAYLAQDFEAMERIARTLKLDADAALWLNLRNNINHLMNERLWNEKLGLYMDFDNDAWRQTDVMSFAAFLPLICGAPSKEQAAKLVAHLKNPETFGAPLPIPTIALCQRQYYSKDMWRGPVWTNINWLVARGLRRYGYEKEAAELQRKTVEEIEKFRSKGGCFYEFYDALRETEPSQLPRKGPNDPANPFRQPIRDYGWTATLYIDTVFSYHFAFNNRYCEL